MSSWGVSTIFSYDTFTVYIYIYIGRKKQLLKDNCWLVRRCLYLIHIFWGELIFSSFHVQVWKDFLGGREFPPQNFRGICRQFLGYVVKRMCFLWWKKGYASEYLEVLILSFEQN